MKDNYSKQRKEITSIALEISNLKERIRKLKERVNNIYVPEA